MPEIPDDIKEIKKKIDLAIKSKERETLLSLKAEIKALVSEATEQKNYPRVGHLEKCAESINDFLELKLDNPALEKIFGKTYRALISNRFGVSLLLLLIALYFIWTQLPTYYKVFPPEETEQASENENTFTDTTDNTPQKTNTITISEYFILKGNKTDMLSKQIAESTPMLETKRLTKADYIISLGIDSAKLIKPKHKGISHHRLLKAGNLQIHIRYKNDKIICDTGIPLKAFEEKEHPIGQPLESIQFETEGQINKIISQEGNRKKIIESLIECL